MREQPSDKDTQMDKTCDICGDVGFEELTATCSKCCIACEHVYCMRVYVKEVQQNWVCEACLLRKGIVLPKSGGDREFLNSRRQVHARKLKAVETGKVKFLPVEDVLKMSTRSWAMGSPQRNNFKLNCDWSHTSAARSRRTLIPSKSVTQEFSRLREKENPSVMSSRFIKSPTHADAQINTMMNHQAAKMSKESKGETCHNVEPKKFAVEERESMNILPQFELYRRYLPALEVTWKWVINSIAMLLNHPSISGQLAHIGGFNLLDTATPGKFYGGFQAQPPCRVHRQAFEFGQKLPEILQVNLLPQCHHLTELFGNDFPDFRDVALYFFPADNIQRSKQKIFCLFELLEIQNSFIRSCINGLELLIFTSKQLHVDSQRIIARTKTEYFLWGVFRRVEANQMLHKVREERTSLISHAECASDDHENVDNTKVIDMDIDMEGGRIVGTFDAVVSKELSGSMCGNNWKKNVNYATEQILLEHKQRFNYFDSSIKFKRESAFEPPLESSQGKSANAENKIGSPAGSEEKSRVNSRIIEIKPGLVDGGVLNHIKEDIGLKGVSGGDFGACSPLPRRFSEDSHSTRSQKHHQDCLAAYPRPLSEKYSKSQMKIKAEEHGYKDKELEVGENHARDKKRCCLPYLEVKAENKIDVRWSPPPKYWVKLNIAGSSSGVSAGASGILHDESGKWILGYIENLGNSNSLAAELRALYQGLKLVWERGFRKVLVESVSHEAVKSLEQSPAFLDPNRSLIECCTDLLKRKWECKVKYTQSEGNLCANWLATHVENQPLGKLAVFMSPPSNLVPLFQNNSTGVAQLHPC